MVSYFFNWEREREREKRKKKRSKSRKKEEGVKKNKKIETNTKK